MTHIYIYTSLTRKQQQQKPKMWGGLGRPSRYGGYDPIYSLALPSPARPGL